MSNNITVEQCQALLKSLRDTDSNNRFLDEADAFILLAENAAKQLIKNGKATDYALDAARKYRNNKLRSEHRCGGDDFNIPDQAQDPTADAAMDAESEEKEKELDELEAALINAAKPQDRKLIIARLKNSGESLCAVARKIGVNQSTAATRLYRLKAHLLAAKNQGDLFGFSGGMEV